MNGECGRFNEAQRHHKTHLHRHHVSIRCTLFYFKATYLVSSFFPLNITRVT